MNKLSANVSTHVLLLKDGSRKFINKRAYDIIWEHIKNGKGEILINDWMLSVSKISELIDMEEFRQRFPALNEDMTPAKPLKTIDQIEAEKGLGIKGVIDKYGDDKAAVKGMIKGMNKFLSDKIPGECPKAEDFLKMMETKLSTPPSIDTTRQCL